MPGLCGVVSRQLPIDIAQKHLERMQDLLRHREDQVIEQPTLLTATSPATGSLALGAVWRRPGLGLATALQPGLSLYVDGEAYGESAPLSPKAFAQVFAEIEPARGDCGALASLDGVYAAALADEDRGILHLFTDPFGLRPLYIRETAGALWFSGELKGMLALGALEIDRLAASDFLRFGHFLGDATWFQGVRLLPPASHLRYDLATGRLVHARYRRWPPDARQNRSRDGGVEDAREGGVKALLGTGRTITSHDAAMALGPLLQEAVARRTGDVSPHHRIGLLLSGGLDSRILFAAMPKEAEPLPVLTFGRPGCRDIHIALQVSATRPSHHDVIEITSENWMSGREEGVWLTDGQLGFLHMHGFESLPRLEGAMETCLSGFLGDALLGGSYLDDPHWTLWEKYLHRGRRFILSGLLHGETGVRFRMPFLDLRLIEALSVLPEGLLRDSRAYRLTLLLHWPEYFKTLPWQKTGLPLSLHPRRERLRVRAGRWGRRLLRVFTRKPEESAEYFDYAAWLRQEPAKSWVEAVLFPGEGKALAPLVLQVLDPAECRRILDQHFAGRDHSDLIGRYLTVALWLTEVSRRVAAAAEVGASPRL